MRLDEVVRVGPSCLDLCLYQKRKREYLREHPRRKGHVRIHREAEEERSHRT